MCERFSLASSPAELAERFGAGVRQLALEPRYNTAPSQPVLTLKDGDGDRLAGFMRWGLVPSWAKGPAGAPLINARAETVATKPAFRAAFRSRRRLIPACGFYEWQRIPGSNVKRPMRVVMKGGEPFAFAGLWETWRGPDGHEVLPCAVVTTGANSLPAPIHDRMPVILRQEAEALWLDRSVEDRGLLERVLQPYDAGDLEAFEVSSLVNSTRNDEQGVAARLI